MKTRPIRDESSTAVTAAALSAAVLIAQQVAGKATRDALFLSHFAPSALPVVMVGSAVLSLGVTLLLGKLMIRSSPARVVGAVSLASSALFGFEWLLSSPVPRLAAAAVYVHTAALGAVVVSCFWSVINERFDPHMARTAVARIARGAAFGGVLGGLAAWQAGTRLPLPTMLLGLAALSGLCAIGVARIDGVSRRAAVARPTPSGFRVLAKVGYLRHLGVLVALGAVAEVAVDYVFKAHASASFATSQSLISFFAIFYTSAAVATFLIQSTLASRVLQRVGLTGAVATQPVAFTVGGALALLFPGLWSVTALRAAAATLGSSLYRSGYELLYTPLAPAEKRATKTMVDVGCDRVGGALGGGVAMLAVAVVPAAAASVLLGVAVAASAVCLLVTRLLHRGYIAALADSLRRGAVDLDSKEVVDAVTRRALADTTMGIDRALALSPASRERTDAAHSDDPLVAAMSNLRSRDAERIRGVLRAGRLSRKLVAHVIPLLARDDLQRAVSRSLAEVAGRTTGQLVDAMLDPATGFAVRRRIPRVLGQCASQRAADGLVAALSDPRFEVRYRAAVALLTIRRCKPAIAVSPDAILDAARREARVGWGIWASQRLLDSSPDDHDPPFAEDGGSGSSASCSLEHVFNLLALVLDRVPLQLAFRALGVDDDRVRGTALEYLEQVLPPDIRPHLWPHLGDGGPARPPGRPAEQIVSDLRRSLTNLSIDLPGPS